MRVVEDSAPQGLKPRLPVGSERPKAEALGYLKAKALRRVCEAAAIGCVRPDWRLGVQSGFQTLEVERQLEPPVTRWMEPRMPEEVGTTLLRSCIWKRSPYLAISGL